MTTETPVAPTTALATRDEPSLTPFEVIERVISSGDLSTMAAPDRVAFYWRTCESLGLNPLTRPFDFIKGDGGVIIMYAKRDATDQLRRNNHVNIDHLERKIDEAMASVTAVGSVPDTSAPGGRRTDSAMGVVFIKGLGGQTLANAIMKAETKAKRRLTLSLVGLGFLDETEIEGIGEAISFDPETGEIREAPAKPLSLLESVRAQQDALAAEPTDDTKPVGATVSEPAPEVASEPASPEPAAAQPAAQAPGLCGAESPYGDEATCGMPVGHLDQPRAVKVHRILADDGTVTASWPAAK